MSLQGSTVLITGASMGIGEAITHSFAQEGANLILFSRSEDKLQTIASAVKKQHPSSKVLVKAVDIQSYEAVEAAVKAAVQELGEIDILINNAGLALGAPSTFSDLKISDILAMNNTNINGLMFATYAVLNASMMPRKAGTILNVTSVTGLEVPPFPGESVYHCNKAAQEAFTNALRNELCGTNIRVLALRPGCVATNFHSLRVGHDKEKYDKFFEGYEPLVSQDIAGAAVYMVKQPLNVSVKAMDVVPSGFVLKPRNFWNYQISATAEVDSISDRRQSLRIPRFQIEDDSYIRQYETKQSVSRAIAHACLSETDAKLAIEGGAFGYSASASGSWSESHSSASGSSTSQDSRVMTITYNFPRVIIDFDPSSLDLSEECKADLEGVNTAKAVEAFKNKYGRFFATRIELGGRLHSSEETQSTDAAASAQQAKSMRAAAALSFSAPWAQASASASHNNSSSSSSESKESASHSTISWEAQGGDTLQCNNPPAWAYTVGSFYNSRAIKKSKVLALEEIISMVPGYQDTKVKFATLLAAAAKPEQEQPDVTTAGRVIKFRLSTAMNDVVVPSTGEDIEIGNILETLREEDSVLTSERLGFLGQLQITRQNSVPLRCVKSESGPTAFSITTSAELPEAKLVYHQLYKIQTVDAAEGQWLGVNPVMSGFLTKTLIWAGDEEDATFFAFVPINDGSKNNYITGDRMVMIALYDENLDRIGLATSMSSSNIGNDVERAREGIYFNVDYIEP